MVKAYLSGVTEIHTMVIGSKIKWMVQVNTLGKTGDIMKENI